MRLMLGLCAVAAAAFLAATCTAGARSNSREEIETFNKHYLELHQKMDPAGVLALWAEDGVDLMPEEAPIIGKKAITAWVEGVLKRIERYKVTKEELEFHDIQVAGEWASEWATEHQVVQAREGQPAIESYGDGAGAAPRAEWRMEGQAGNVERVTQAVSKAGSG